MVGNDIVDLCDPDADSTRYSDRFDARVFTRAERRAIADSQSHERKRWRLWAAKEASYKLARRYDTKTVFSPRAFVVGPDEGGHANRARVVHGETSYFVEFDETPQRIHAIAVSRPHDFALVLAGVEAMDTSLHTSLHPAPDTTDESDAVRKLACDAISRRFELPRDQLTIRKFKDRIPGLYRRDAPLGLSISLSHHGSWLAFACCQGEDGAA
jgi:phosphopantetheinyl transferase (holo-ACP synthase)